jgi:hypothetical protein
MVGAAPDSWLIRIKMRTGSASAPSTLRPLAEEHKMNGDPLLTGTVSSFTNLNSSTVPTVWEEDMVQAAEQGFGCAAGPMLTLTKKSTDQQFLPDGTLNPCREFSPVPETLVVENLRVDAGVTSELAAARIASGTRGVVGSGTTQGVNGTGTGAGSFGVVGSGTATGVNGTGTGAGSFGVVGRGTATGVNGTGTGAVSFGVVGVGVTAGVWGGNRRRGGIGVVGVPGPDFISGGTINHQWAGRFDGPVWVRTTGGAAGDLTVDGSLLVWGSTKASVVPHPDGSRRVMHCMEAPESWFEDIGRAQLREGSARVDIDPDFAAVSGLGDDYHVFLTAEGPSNGLYVSDRTSTGFEVREQGEATSEITFSYRIITKRTNGGTGRLEPIDLPSDAVQKATAEPAELPPHGVPTSPEEPDSAPPA